MTENVTEFLLNVTNSTATIASGLDPTEALILRLIAIIMAVCFPIGFIVNVLALITLCRESTHNATENIFIGLTFADTMTNLSGCFVNFIILLSYYTSLGQDPFFTQNFKYFVRSDIVIYMTSFLISGALSVERIFAVFRPTTFRKIWTPWFGTFTVVAGSGSTLLVSILITTLISEDALLLFRVVFTAICVGIVLISNAFVLFGLLRQRSKIGTGPDGTGSGSSTMSATERRQTNILVVISLLFVVCGSTNMAVALVSMLDSQDYGLGQFLVFVYGYTRWFFQVIYSVLNSLIFVFYNKKYRKRFLNVLRCRC